MKITAMLVPPSKVHPGGVELSGDGVPLCHLHIARHDPKEPGQEKPLRAWLAQELTHVINAAALDYQVAPESEEQKADREKLEALTASVTHPPEEQAAAARPPRRKTQTKKKAAKPAAKKRGKR